MTTLNARLVVADADAAIRFYETVFGAETLERFRDDKIGKVVHAALSLGDGVIISLADADPGFGNRDPKDLGGSPVLLHLSVDDADSVGARFVAEGGEVVFPIADQFYGRREGRLRDPFGHLWIVGHVLEELPPDEIQRRVDTFHDD